MIRRCRGADDGAGRLAVRAIKERSDDPHGAPRPRWRPALPARHRPRARKTASLKATTAATPSTAPTMATCGSTAAPGRCRSAPGGRSAGPARRWPDERAALEAEIARLQNENVALKRELLAHNLPLPGVVKPEPPVAKNEEPRLNCQRCRAQQDDGVRREGLAPHGRDDRDPAEGRVEEVMSAARGAVAADRRRSAITRLAPELLASTTLVVETGGRGLHRDHARCRALRRRGRRPRRRAAAVPAAHVGLARHPGECRSRRADRSRRPRSRGLRPPTPAGCTTRKAPTTCRRT